MHRISRYLILLCFCFHSLSATVYKWGSATGTDAWNGDQSGAVIHPDSSGLVKNSDGDGVLTLQPNDTLGLFEKVGINGTIEVAFPGTPVSIDAQGTVTGAAEEICYVDVGYSSENQSWDAHAGPVTVAPSKDAGASKNFSHLVFNPGQNRTIFVTVNDHLTFSGKNDTTSDVSVDDGMPLQVSFRGKGTTVFALQSGVQLSFTREDDGLQPAAGMNIHGTHVRVLMEQSSLEAQVEERNQLIFRRAFYDDQDEDKHCWIRFGQKSSFCFLSDNVQGVSEKWVDVDGDKDIDDGEPVLHASYGTVAFDVSNRGTGRMILELARGLSQNDYTDAAFNVYGAYVKPTTPATDTLPAVIKNDDLRDTDENGFGSVYYNQRAGIMARMRIIDSVAYATRLGVGGDLFSPQDWVERPLSDRRGLLVINHNNSIAKFANNFDNATRIDQNRWALSNSYQPGFVLGVNAELSVQPHLFLDYVANNQNKALAGIHTSFGSDVTKKHNPAALVVDGLASYKGSTRLGLDTRGLKVSDLLYAGVRPEFGINAKIMLYGDAGIFVRAAAPLTDGALVTPQFVREASSELVSLPLVPGDETSVMTFAMGAGYYDKDFVPIVDDAGVFVMQSEESEGSHCMDLEGRLTIESVVGPSFQDQSTQVPGVPASGFLKIPSIQIGHDGQEVALSDNGSVLTPVTVTQRPLSDALLYSVYDVSSVLVNDDLTLSGVTWIHDDVTRNHGAAILPHTGDLARPHVVGGELSVIHGTNEPPLISLYSSTLACHESFVSAGVRFVVTELPIFSGEPLEKAHNTARIDLYNRGFLHDSTGFGRVFQLGANGNRTASGATTTLLTDSFIDVYRAAPVPGATDQTVTPVTLSVASQHEPLAPTSQKSLHTLYLAHGSQINLGWTTLEADSGFRPWNFDDTILTHIKMGDPDNRYGYRFPTYTGGDAHLEFAGTPICVAAGDAEGDTPDLPIPGRDVDGVVYVNHGGKMSVAGTNDLFLSTVIARRVSREAHAHGELAFARDQVHYLAPSGVIQDYDIDLSGGNMPYYLGGGTVFVNTSDSVSSSDSFGSVK